jgi:hypothetical protein
MGLFGWLEFSQRNPSQKLVVVFPHHLHFGMFSIVPFRRFFDSFLVKFREVDVEIEIDRERKKR